MFLAEFKVKCLRRLILLLGCGLNPLYPSRTIARTSSPYPHHHTQVCLSLDMSQIGRAPEPPRGNTMITGHSTAFIETLAHLEDSFPVSKFSLFQGTVHMLFHHAVRKAFSLANTRLCLLKGTSKSPPQAPRS